MEQKKFEVSSTLRMMFSFSLLTQRLLGLLSGLVLVLILIWGKLKKFFVLQLGGGEHRRICGKDSRGIDCGQMRLIMCSWTDRKLGLKCLIRNY